MQASSTAFHAVYHVTTINHWQLILDEQLAILLRSHNLKSLTLTVATTSALDFADVQDRVARAVQNKTPRFSIEFQSVALHQFEHPAMLLIDQLASVDDLPILYFHMKGVSHSPPAHLWEIWRRHMNQLVAEADRWANFLMSGRHDVCGTFLTFDADHRFHYFAGNFWMAKATYLRRLPDYSSFMLAPGTPHFSPNSRYLAEIAVNRTREMNAFAIDGRLLTPQGVFQQLDWMAKYRDDSAGVEY